MDNLFYDWKFLLTAGAFILLNAFFVAAEYSIVKIRRSKLDELAMDGNKRAVLASKITDKLDSYLEAAQFGMTVSALALGWIGISALTAFLRPVFGAFLKNNPSCAVFFSFGAAFIIITLLYVVFGAFVPKSVALQKTEGTVLRVVRPLYFFHMLFKPFLLVFDGLTNLVLKPFGLKSTEASILIHSEEEIKLIASASMRGGVIDKTESEIIKNAVDFSDKIAREIMIPRQDMECWYKESSFEENMQTVRETGYTRYPVCHQDKDNVLGMVHLRDLMMNAASQDISKILREILFVSETMSVSDVLLLMKKRKIHMAVVIDEYGGTSGLLSMEDVLEELVGDIQDEHDEPEEAYERKLDDGTYEFSGLALLEEALEYMGLPYDEEIKEDTIGGYVFSLLARKPEKGDIVDTSLCTYEILDIEGFRVKKVKATPKFGAARADE